MSVCVQKYNKSRTGNVMKIGNHVEIDVCNKPPAGCNGLNVTIRYSLKCWVHHSNIRVCLSRTYRKGGAAIHEHTTRM